jgi:hypothetical protein
MWRVISHQPWRPGARSWGHDQWIAPIKMSARAERPARATRHLVQNARPRFISSLTYSTVAMGRCFAFFDASAENFSGTSKPASVGGRSRTSPERTPAIARAPFLGERAKIARAELPYPSARSISEISSADVCRFTSNPHVWPHRQLAHLNVGEKNAYPLSCPRDFCDHLGNWRNSGRS